MPIWQLELDCLDCLLIQILLAMNYIRISEKDAFLINNSLPFCEIYHYYFQPTSICGVNIEKKSSTFDNNQVDTGQNV